MPLKLLKDSLLSPVEFREIQEWFQGNNQQQFSFRGMILLTNHFEPRTSPNLNFCLAVDLSFFISQEVPDLMCFLQTCLQSSKLYFLGFTFPESKASQQMLMCNIKICDKTNNNSDCKSYCYDV